MMKKLLILGLCLVGYNLQGMMTYYLELEHNRLKQQGSEKTTCTQGMIKQILKNLNAKNIKFASDPIILDTSIVIGNHWFTDKKYRHYLKPLTQYGLGNYTGTPTHLLIWFINASNSKSLEKILLEMIKTINLNLNKQDSLGLTPLHLALLFNQNNIALQLIQSGVDLLIQTNQTVIPLGLEYNANATPLDLLYKTVLVDLQMINDIFTMYVKNHDDEKIIELFYALSERTNPIINQHLTDFEASDYTKLETSHSDTYSYQNLEE